MVSQTLNETDAEVFYGSFTNVAGQTITTGNAVSVCTTAASIDGKSFVLSQDNNRHSFAGIAAEDVADTGTGRFIAYGYAASTLAFGLGTSIICNIDDPMGPGEAASLGVNSAGLITSFGPVVALETITTSADTYFRAWVRAM